MSLSLKLNTRHYHRVLNSYTEATHLVDMCLIHVRPTYEASHQTTKKHNKRP